VEESAPLFAESLQKNQVLVRSDGFAVKGEDQLSIAKL
jgi:hypothetical protein